MWWAILLWLGCAAPQEVAEGPCGRPLTHRLMTQSLALGTEFLLNNQQPEGNFVYAFDWKEAALLDQDNEVRQAGATWGLTLIHHDTPDEMLRPSIERALSFFEARSRVANGKRWIVYPGSQKGSLGTVAILALAHIEVLRIDDAFDEAKRRILRTHLDEYLAFLVSAHKKEGRFHRYYDHETGEPYGLSTPYADGEALLAFVGAAVHLGIEGLDDRIRFELEAGYQLNIHGPLQEDADPKVTKGYYQWSSMAWFQLIEAGWPEADLLSERLTSLAIWMIDDHRTLERTRNTGYAYEGIIPAWKVAKDRQDPRADKLACTIHQGMRKLTSWQVGSVVANPYVRQAPSDDVRSLGGVQNHAEESLLRIDTTQHQMHAVILARRYFVTGSTM